MKYIIGNINSSTYKAEISLLLKGLFEDIKLIHILKLKKNKAFAVITKKDDVRSEDEDHVSELTNSDLVDSQDDSNQANINGNDITLLNGYLFGGNRLTVKEVTAYKPKEQSEKKKNPRKKKPTLKNKDSTADADD
jgi:hypothetical protein